MIAFKPYPEYSDITSTCFGGFPTHWRFERLGKHFLERKETVSDREYQPLSVTKNGILPQLETAAKTDNGDNRKKVVAGDFVINSRSDRKGSAGISPLDGSVSIISTVITPLGLDSSFVHQLLRSQPFQEEYYRFGSGIVADLWSTRYTAMKNIRLPVPPEDEQRAIASFLDHETAEIDAFIADQQELIRLLNERRAATITQAVTKGLDPNAPMKDSGVEWLSAIPEHWHVTKLGRSFEVVLGKMLDGGKDPRAEAVLLPYIRAANIQDDGLDTVNANRMYFVAAEIANLSLRGRDLLVVEGGSIGTCYVLREDMPGWSFQKTVNRVRTRGVHSTEFLAYVIRMYRDSEVLDTICNRSTIIHLTAEKLHNLVVPLPPVTEQQRVIDYLDCETAEIDAAIADAREAIELSKERRAALISAAVTGKIDVRDHPSATGAA